MYTYHRGLVRHMTYECGVDSKFQCAMCGRPFKRKENMKSHMMNIHKTVASTVFEINSFDKNT